MPSHAQNQGKEPGAFHRIIGVWSLLSFTAHAPGGDTIHLFGEHPAGRISYDAEGRVSVQIMRRGRPRFAFGDPSRGTPEELAAAFGGYLAYYGSYRLDEGAGEVTHFLEACSFPNWEGSAQVRYFSFAGDILTLRTPPIQVGSAGGSPVEAVLVWKREG